VAFTPPGARGIKPAPCAQHKPFSAAVEAAIAAEPEAERAYFKAFEQQVRHAS
jgi:hypothetical protein